MPRQQRKSGRDGGSGGSRTTRSEGDEDAPLVSAKRGKFAKLSEIKVEALVYARLCQYKEFVREMDGEEADEGAILSAGLERLFDADQGFQRWLNGRRKTTSQALDSNNPKVGQRPIAASTVAPAAM